MSETSWISDFTVSGRDVRVKKTGAMVRVDRTVAGEAAVTLLLDLTYPRSAGSRSAGTRGPSFRCWR